MDMQDPKNGKKNKKKADKSLHKDELFVANDDVQGAAGSKTSVEAKKKILKENDFTEETSSKNVSSPDDDSEKADSDELPHENVVGEPDKKDFFGEDKHNLY